ncbi:anti-sigma factor family protein [Streptomyces sp. NPDC058683]|uniref:anti-sigma factor family protein n=1 Tax=Streptomyces sp. NPDC058683 TaxID=3346597 RepID=UPI003659933A
MTSTTDTTGHPDVAEISDLTEGLLPDARTAEVRQHLDECELCADVHASLEEIRGLLGTVPGPSRMPADVAGRIDAALAAEALLNATAPETHVSRETSTLASPPVGRPAGRSSASTGPGRKDRGQDRGQAHGKGRGRRRRTVVLGAVLTAAVLGAGSFFLQSLGGDGPTTAQGQPTNSAAGFSKSTLPTEVENLLGTKTGLRGSNKPDLGIKGEATSPGSTDSPYTTRIQPSAQVPPCVRQGISQNDDVLGAKKGTYEGKDAFLVVLPDTSDSTRVTVFIVDATCDSRSSASPGEVLLTESVARP